MVGTTTTSTLLSRKALPLVSVPVSPISGNGGGEYDAWVDKLIQDALGIVGSMNRWRLSTSHQKDTVQTYTLPCHYSGRDAQPSTPEGSRPALQVHKDELWAGRRSLHFIPRVRRASLTGGVDIDNGEVEEESEELERNGGGLFEAFEEGLLRRHTEHEKQYIESLKEVERVGVVREGEAEVWKMVYSMPSPLSPRTFVELVIAKELPPIPGKLPPGFHTNHLPRPCRQFVVISLPIDDRNSSLPSPPYSAETGTPGSSTPPSTGSGIATPDSVVSPTTPAASRPSMNGRVSTSSSGGKDKTVRARYVSVEWVKEVDLQLAGFEHGEIDGGPRVVRGVEWVMATSSSAGGNVPQAVTNMSLPSKITEDVPAFLSWMAKKSPQLGKIESKKL